MIITIRKANLLFLILICVLSYMIYDLYLGEEVATIALPTFNRVFIIDAGHGSPDGGASGQSGVLEKDINLAIAQKLQVLIEQSGGIAVITRASDEAIYNSDANSIRSKKRSDLKNRKKIMEESEADVFISIHLNKFEQSKYYGAQVFYSTKNPESKLLGQTIQKELIEGIDNGNTRKAKPATNDIYLLKNTEMPAVIVECGFLSNPEEERLLQTEQYQKRLAWSIYIGLMKYFNN